MPCELQKCKICYRNSHNSFRRLESSAKFKMATILFWRKCENRYKRRRSILRETPAIRDKIRRGEISGIGVIRYCETLRVHVKENGGMIWMRSACSSIVSGMTKQN